MSEESQLFFLYDPEGDYRVQTFPTEAERDAAAEEAIRAYVDSDGWSEDVERIVVGMITGRATQCDVNRPSSKLNENCEDGAGTYWGGQVAMGVPEEEMMTCGYRIEPVLGKEVVELSKRADLLLAQFEETNDESDLCKLLAELVYDMQSEIEERLLTVRHGDV